jgi:diaminopimelate decarboxylase
MSPRDLPPYERPSITRHQAGFLNKMGGGPVVQARNRIDGVPVEELVEQYGSPLFVYSEKTQRDRVTDLREHLERRWPRVQIAWSYKTCYLDAVCRVYHDEGSWAEVVSGMEYDKALRNGVAPEHIIFNGPHKSRKELKKAFTGGSIVNLDHFDELANAEAVARELGVRPKVGIRLNMAAPGAPRWGRFGFDLEAGTAWDAVRRLMGGGQLQLVGLHSHIGTFVTDPKSYEGQAAKLAGFANKLRRELGINVEYIDVGGGFASSAKLKAQYLPGEQTTPSLGQYAEAITEGLSALDVTDSAAPLLILETGRALIATVIANKRLPDGRRAVVLDAGVNVLFTSYWYKHRIVPTTTPRGTPEPTVLYGPLCMNIDVVCDNLMLPPLEVGSRVLIEPVGAYNVTQSMQFIHLRPAVTMIGLDGQHGVIRRAETLDDLVMGESVPDWLG